MHSLISPWERKGRKEKKNSSSNTGYLDLVTQPSTIPVKQGLTLRKLFSKVPLACPITKARNSSHFHIPLIFLFPTFPAMQYHISFSFFDTFSHLGNLKQCVHRGVTTPQGQQDVWSAQ